MNNNEKLQRIIAVYSPVVYTEIKLHRNIKNNYVYEDFKDDLASDIANAWPENIDSTMLHNELFVTLKTGKSIFLEFEIVGDEQY